VKGTSSITWKTIRSGAWHAPEDDELRFGKNDRILRSLAASPEMHETATDAVTPWLAGDLQMGLLRLTGAAPNQLDLAQRRVHDSRNDVLACIKDEAFQVGHEHEAFRVGAEPAALQVGKRHLALTIAQDVDLLFATGRACGSLLRHPQRYLNDGWQEPPAFVGDEFQFAELLADCGQLVCEANMAAFETADPEMLEALRGLEDRARSIPASPQRDGLLAAIDAQIDQFFD
jgi:hypothetical protein